MKERKVLVCVCLLVVLAGMILLEGRAPLNTLAERDAGFARTGRAGSPAIAGADARTDAAAIEASYAQLPLQFEANSGQTDPRVKFLARGAGYTLFLTGDEAVLTLQRSVLRLQLEGANGAARVEGLDRQSATSNYFIGHDPSRWRSGVANFARVRYRDIYRGVDLIYCGRQRQLEYDLVIAPGADPRDIAFRIAGAEQARLDNRGNLILGARGGEVRLRKPVIYQETAGGRKEIAGGYAIRGADLVGFTVSAYDASRQLVIDPTLLYSTYLGGNSTDRAAGIAIDANGNGYLAGSTQSTDFPGAANGLQPNLRGVQNIFVAKLNASGNHLVYATYVGGTDTDKAAGIAIDGSGNAFVTGSTNTTDFPTTAGVFQTKLKGMQNAFVFKLNANGNALIYSTFVGGSKTDAANGIGIDKKTGEAYIAGQTNSADFPKAAAAQANLNGSQNAFVTKLKSDGTALVFSTYLGGAGTDGADGIAVDSSSNAYVVGSTTSNNFPLMTPLQGALAGPSNAFVAKFSSSGALSYSTYLGGSGIDQGNAIAVDGTGEAFVTGTTTSSNFPQPVGPVPFQPSLGAPGAANAFVAKLNAAGSALVFSTYLGGSGGEQGLGIALDSTPNVYVTGQTRSANFPTLHPFQPALGSSANAFVTELKSDGTALVYSTYLGGNGVDFGSAAVVDSNGNAFVAGSTQSSNFPLVSPEQTFLNGGTDAFAVKISHTAAPGALFSPATLNFPTTMVNVSSMPLMAMLTNSGDAALTISSVSITGTNPGDFSQTNTCGTSVAAGANCTVTVTFKPTAGDTRTALLSVSDNAVGNPHTVTLAGTGNAPAPVVSLFPPQIVFSAVTVGQKSTAQGVTLANNGTAVLNITSIAFAGNNKGDFSQTNNCGSKVNAGSTCVINVVFQPTAAGQRTAVMTVTDDAITSPQIVGVLGGSDFGLTVAPSPVSVVAGQAVTTTLFIVPGNGFNQQVTFACTGQPVGSTCTLNPATLTLDGTNIAQSLLTVTTTAHSNDAPRPWLGLPPRAHPLAPWLALLALVAALIALRRAAAGRPRVRLGFVAVIALFALAAGCGGGGGGGGNIHGTPAGNSTLTVTGTAGTQKQTTTFILLVQ